MTVLLMNDRATLASNTVGLWLSDEEERQVVRLAARECGLEPLDLGPSLGRPDEDAYETTMEETREPVGTSRAIRGLPMIVTDRGWEALDREGVEEEDFPFVMVVRNEGKAGDAARDTRDAWVLHRPLRAEAVRAQLRQAIYANQIFLRRHHAVLEESYRARTIFDSVGNGITIADARLPDLPLVYVNAAFEQMTGYSAKEVCGRNCRFLQQGDTDQPGLSEVREAIREKRHQRALLKNYRKDGTPFWNELYLSPLTDLEGRVKYFVGIQNDVTKQVESAARVDFLATHDYLTGLVTRGVLMDQLKQGLARARRNGRNIAVLFFDLDNFKHVNDVLGHEAGDRLLQVVAGRLRAETRSDEVVARLGGDEFVVVLEGACDEHWPANVVQRLTSRVSEAVEFLEQAFYPSASVGMALFPYNGDTPEALLRVADFNMYTAKHASKSGSRNNEESLSNPA